MKLQEASRIAAQKLKSAQALIITSGAGMGVDSGLPDFRGNKGFWKAYPMYERLGLNFFEAANPAHFIRDPAFGWGFYGHRAGLYSNTHPHEGFTCCGSGLIAITWIILSLHQMWTVIIKRQALPRKRSLKYTAPSATFNAPGLVRGTSGLVPKPSR